MISWILQVGNICILIVIEDWRHITENRCYISSKKFLEYNLKETVATRIFIHNKNFEVICPFHTGSNVVPFIMIFLIATINDRNFVSHNFMYFSNKLHRNWNMLETIQNSLLFSLLISKIRCKFDIMIVKWCQSSFKICHHIKYIAIHQTDKIC